SSDLCRINAEDPERGFLPSPGTIRFYHAPGGIGVRVDSAAYTGWTVPPYYDSLIAKLIVHAGDRDAAIAKALAALEEFRIEGIKTNVAYHKEILDHPKFRAGELSTNFIDLYMAR